MTELLLFLVGALFLIVIGLTVALFALARQVGVLFERVSPMGALINDAGPRIGEATPQFALPSLTGGTVVIGPRTERATLVFFLSTTCPVCKKLLPVLRSVRSAERRWLDVVLASDGEREQHLRFIETAGLKDFPYVLSEALGVGYRVSRLPFAVLIDAAGTIKSKGLVNSREQLESLFNAEEMGFKTIQDYLEAPSVVRH